MLASSTYPLVAELLLGVGAAAQPANDPLLLFHVCIYTRKFLDGIFDDVAEDYSPRM